MLNLLKNNISLYRFSLILSGLNFLFFHYSFFGFVLENLDYQTMSGAFTLVSLVILMLMANTFAFSLILFLGRFLGRIIIAITFIISAISVYFISTYSIIVDESMIGNVLNTNYDESSAFLSYKILIYIILLGILPSIFILKSKINYGSTKKFFITSGIILGTMVAIAFANSNHWLWIDKYSKQLGGLAMPWSYSVNTSLYYIHQAQKNRQEILLPDASIKNNEKSIVVLVIGESARSQNFSLYGYSQNTNPLLSKTENVFHFPATSCATYTTAGVKCILEYENTDELYEILPNYLHRNNVDVIWRTTNSGEPPIHIDQYQDKEALRKNCKGEYCDYDEVLLSGLKDEVLSSKKDKILVILHTGTSHGPTYNQKYPPHFGHFKPVCNSVELAKCSPQELINAYDNTILYTDYLLHQVIDNLKDIKGFNKTMLYVSDHGESLGEKNLYMHGLPMNLAPREQYEIPFIIWTDGTRKLKPLKELSQHNVFHSVLNFLSIDSPIYKEEMNIFQ